MSNASQLPPGRDLSPPETGRPETRRSRRTGLWRVASVVLTLGAGAVFFGFLLFAANAMRIADPILSTAGDTPADGIIVLTGGDHRIVEGARLLRAKAGRRLLISGVNAQTRRDDIVRLSGLKPSLFRCCVDLGYAAQDTIGNAEEARIWASGLGARRLIVVTSGYHMPRSIAELTLAMPTIELIPYPVVSKSVRERAWWLQPGLVRALATEYAKFLPVAARYAVARHVAPIIAPAEAVPGTAARAAVQ